MERWIKVATQDLPWTAGIRTCGTSVWLFSILNMTNVGLQFTQYAGYIGGARVGAFMAQNWVIAAMTATVVVALIWITVIGLRVGKWVHTRSAADSWWRRSR